VPNGPEDSDIGFEQMGLRGDMELVRTYGESHPGAWVQALWENEPSVRIVAVLTGPDIGKHEVALRGLVRHPDRIQVRWAPWSFARLEEIRNEVTSMAKAAEPGVFSGWGTGKAVVVIRLRADQEDLAKELRELYGEAVELTVGSLRFPNLPRPDGEASPWTSRSVADLPLLPSGAADLWLESQIEVRSGQNAHGRFLVRNLGIDELVVKTNGQVTARVVDPTGPEVIGIYAGAQTMPLVRFTARPGEVVKIPLLIGTACPNARLGYATPPGQWELELVLNLEGKGNFRVAGLAITVLS
jgi:hypothetical protein